MKLKIQSIKDYFKSKKDRGLEPKKNKKKQQEEELKKIKAYGESLNNITRSKNK